MVTKKNKILILVFAAASALASLIAFPFLPDQIPTNWGLNGEITYGGKEHALYIGLIPLLLAPLYLYLPKIDPRRKNYDRFSKYYGGFGIFLMVFLFLLNAIVLSESLWPGHISVSKVLPLMVGIMLIFIGNMMPKFKSNFFIGIKTVWTISSTNVWNKTHRLGGLLFFWCGVLFCLTALWLPDNVMFWMLLGTVLICAVVPTVMSYVWYRQEEKKAEEREEE